MRIKSLEDLFIHMGHDPNDIKATEQLINKKNDDTVAMKKKFENSPAATSSNTRSHREPNQT